MRILIINPNSDPKMTSVILSAAESFAGDTFEVVCKPTPGAPAFIDSYMDEIGAAPGMAELDGVVCGLIILCGMVRSGIRTSKIGRFRPRV